jgi:hypothetical protein
VKVRLALAVAALVLVGSLAAGVTATAAPKAEPSAKTVGKVKRNKNGTATVKAHYICPSGPNWHLWVSAKQAADGSRDDAITQEGAGGGGVAAAWLQSHPVTFKCDGKWHTQKFRIDTEEQGYGELIRGYAWVQFCLIDEPAEVFLIDQHWSKVR